VTAWNYAKWPVLLVIVLAIVALLYYATPNVTLRGLKWVLPGALFALVIWLIATVAFAFYVANFGSYDKTYGTLGGIVVFLVWLWITNVALLLGAELSAERERSIELRDGVQGQCHVA
jgi:membrane protein